MPKPTDQIANAAKQGLKERQKYIDAGVEPPATRVGVERANQLVNKENLSLETITRMISFLERHTKNYKPNKKIFIGTGDKRKQTLTKGTISFLLWGGEPALKWAILQKRKLTK